MAKSIHVGVSRWLKEQGPTRFAPTVTMPGGGVVTPEGWMWVLKKLGGA